MAWQLTGTYYAPCSCKVGCPCALGELEADQGWCSAVLVFQFQSGNADGTDLRGAKAALAGDWPSGFLSANGTARLYFDPAISPEQRTALEAILSGQRGGVFEMLGTLVSNVLPTKEAPINIQSGADETQVTVGDFGQLVVKPLRGPSGEFTRLLHAAAGFRDDIILAKGTGSRWRDPDMRQWESGGHAEQTTFDWSA